MTRKKWLWIGLVCVLVIACVHFMHGLRPPPMKIFHTSRPSGYMMRTRRTGVPPLSFGLEGRFQLTEIKVVPLAEWQTNQYAPALWHLISDSNSVPMTGFVYGQRIRGMKPVVPGAQPEPLQTNIAYRLFVAAGKIKGQHDFEVR